ncbi:unnamed protein product [Chondrus crispus]|uniref:Uncharacterized protein n=1 Tax=Chondrus crispus TaxID=2769 RepID=R7QMJ5_CHOCR|nr:unnamed protein product [Chondrus crispus]CDF38605.1 unnamed protein product [Chondrus crispus]|eukprot:XP_005718510.1 unnamed protein product [Chondrus crispus]
MSSMCCTINDDGQQLPCPPLRNTTHISQFKWPLISDSRRVVLNTVSPSSTFNRDRPRQESCRSLPHHPPSRSSPVETKRASCEVRNPAPRFEWHQRSIPCSPRELICRI